ncbi:MAG TPA: histidinol-phosphate transaminase [Deltaproteobacteria bacterium]|nr:histidinol-phosphate transaminase [Deltaproteobacteria bacterium]
MEHLVSENIRRLIPYPPGKPLEELEREYGIKGSIKLASNENPLGPSPKAVEAIKKALGKLHRYPDGSGYYLRRRLSEKFDLPFDGIVLGNGSNEIIDLLIRTFLTPEDEVIVTEPSFLVYRLMVQAIGGEPISVPLKNFALDLNDVLEKCTDKTKIVFLNNPNNPTGSTITAEEFRSFFQKLPSSTIVVLDEAYIEFVRQNDVVKGFEYVGNEGPFVVTLRTFSKAYGLAGLRIGYGAMHPLLADYINRVRQPFNANSLAQIGALAALDDEDFMKETQKTVWEGLGYLYSEVEKMGLEYVPSEANFFLIRVNRDAKEIYEAMLRKGVIVRAMNAYGLPDYIRVNVGKPEENERFVSAFREVMGLA